jgi:hypothetical protein
MSTRTHRLPHLWGATSCRKAAPPSLTFTLSYTNPKQRWVRSDGVDRSCSPAALRCVVCHPAAMLPLAAVVMSTLRRHGGFSSGGGVSRLQVRAPMHPITARAHSLKGELLA